MLSYLEACATYVAPGLALVAAVTSAATGSEQVARNLGWILLAGTGPQAAQSSGACGGKPDAFPAP
jgi:hypothetical protein